MEDFVFPAEQMAKVQWVNGNAPEMRIVIVTAGAWVDCSDAFRPEYCLLQLIPHSVARTSMAYHSAASPGVYHTYANCTKGNNIEKKNRKSGTGGGKLCDECSRKSAK